MGIALNEEHRELARVVRSLLESRYRDAARLALDAEEDELPALWHDAAGLGWLGIHLPEAVGGQGFGVEELAIVVEELGRGCAPGPFLSTVVASALIAEVGSEDQQQQHLPGLADGSVVAAVGLWGDLSLTADGLLEGETGPLLGGGTAGVILLAVGDDVAIVDADAPGVALRSAPNTDRTRRCVLGTFRAVRVGGHDLIAGGRQVAIDLFRTLAAADAAGGSAACLEMSTTYAKAREAFGRPIGQFQAVKHHCADMLVASELANATAWDAARASGGEEATVAAAMAASVALDAYLQCAKLTIQVHGGIGFTWEHDAHLFLRRAMSLMSLTGPIAEVDREIAQLVASGHGRTLAVELPPEAAAVRAEVRSFLERYAGLSPEEQKAALIDDGYLYPHWPKPWGRGAGPLEQIVIDEEFAGIDRTAGASKTAWVLPVILPTIMAHGTEEQKERWIGPSIEGTLAWCQLLSEPDAGSDLASLRTTAVRTDGGWLVSGSKVWTTGAQYASLGFALVRTDLDAPKHRGITCMAIDMHAPGVEIQPLREITGNAAFNQEFFDEVFVPDENVIGEVNQGWTVARTNLGNERVSLGVHLHDTLSGLVDRCAFADTAVTAELGALLAEAHSIRLVNLRQATLTLIGSEPGPGGNITKLATAEHIQRVAEFAYRLAGIDAVFAGEGSRQMLFSRGSTIAGGTSEIVRNTIGEAVLGLPRDPLPR